MVRPAVRFRLSPLQPGLCAKCPVRKLAAYSGVPVTSLKFLQAARAGHRFLPPKRNIYREEKESDEVFTLYDGWAFTFKLFPDGRRQILDFLLPGSLIGLHALWSKAMPHSAQTLTSVSLCAFDKEKFRYLLRRRSEFAWELLKYMGSSQTSRDRRLSDIGRRPAKERVARLVLEIFDQAVARNMADGNSIPFPLRQEHIADALGLTKVHISRTLQALRQEGLLEVERGTATIHDIKGLRELPITPKRRLHDVEPGADVAFWEPRRVVF